MIATRKAAGLVSGVVLVALAAAACSGSGQATPGSATGAALVPATVATSALPSTTVVAPPTTTTPPVTTTAPAAPARTTTAVAPADRAAVTPECTVHTLSLKLGPSDDGMGHHFQELDFTNVSRSACFLVGFPGVSYVDFNGHQVSQAATRDGLKGGRVTLAPGAVASSDVSMTNPSVFDPAQCKVTKVAGLRVYPPDSFAAMFISVPRTACSAQLSESQLLVQTIKSGVGVG